MDATTRGHRTQIVGVIFFTLLLLTMVHLPTMAQSGCYPHDTAYVVGNMNIRERATTDSPVVATAGAGDSFAVSESQQGDTWCWLSIGAGWMAKTSRVSSTKPSDTSSTAGPRANLEPQSPEVITVVDNCCFIGWQCSTDEEWSSGYWAFQSDQCDSPTEWQSEWDQRKQREQRDGGMHPVIVIRDPFTRVHRYIYEDGLEIIIRPSTPEEFCDALERDGEPLPPECEED